MNNLYLIILAPIILIILSIIINIVLRIKNYQKLVLTNSDRIKQLLLINEDTVFLKFQTNYNLYQKCSTKKQLNKLVLKKYFLQTIEQQFDYFSNIYNQITNNVNNYKVYVQKINSLSSTATELSCALLKTSLKKFLYYENKLFNKNLLTPILDISITITASYSSASRKNQYSKTAKYDYSAFAPIFEEAKNLIEKKKSRKYKIKKERAKLTDSLRYDILKRDGFRCQICGATADDGVKLHIDHILPVSKGGLTVTNNLRVLCDKCNLGKSDKIE